MHAGHGLSVVVAAGQEPQRETAGGGVRIRSWLSVDHRRGGVRDGSRRLGALPKTREDVSAFSRRRGGAAGPSTVLQQHRGRDKTAATTTTDDLLQVRFKAAQVHGSDRARSVSTAHVQLPGAVPGRLLAADLRV